MVNLNEVVKMHKYKKILTEKLGQKLHYFKTVDSTNTVAKKMEVWSHGTVVIAETQTAGRGTYGRTFYSKGSRGIYMTLIINIDDWHFKQPQLATLYTAVAVSEAIANITKISPDIKWVNDLFLTGKKIGGILTEKVLQSNRLIIGIGVNVSGKKEDFPEELQKIAGSLALDDPIDDQAAAIVNAIYEKMLKPGELSNEGTVLELYKKRLFILGQTVEMKCGEDVFEGKVIDVDDEGRLVVLRDGLKLVLGVGEVRIKL